LYNPCHQTKLVSGHEIAGFTWMQPAARAPKTKCRRFSGNLTCRVCRFPGNLEMDVLFIMATYHHSLVLEGYLNGVFDREFTNPNGGMY
jgi:hypothetical protein